MARALCKLVVVVLCVCGVLATDEYIDEVKEQCRAKSDFLSCGKYEAAKYITRTVVGEPTKVIGGVLEFVTLGSAGSNDTLFASTRQMHGDSEYSKFFKFVQRQLNGFLGSRAIAVSLPDQVKIVDTAEPSNEIFSDVERFEARGKKKKVAMILPLITLFKLFKVKVLLALVLAGILFIKKAIALLFLLAPSYLQMLKICKVPHYTHVEEHDYGSTGYGYPHVGHGHHGGAYAKEWANSRAYSAHKPT